MNKLNNIIDLYSFKIFTIFLLLQPVIDVFTSIQSRYFNYYLSFGVVIRFLFLLFILHWIIFISKSKYRKISLYYLLFVSIYIMIFIFISLNNKGMELVVDEIKWLIKNMYFPISLVGFIQMFESNNNQPRIEMFIKNLTAYIAIIVFSQLLGISLDAYTQGKTGYIGVFNSANEISAIISILFPFLIFSKNIKHKIWMLLFVVYIALIIGSKSAFLSLFLVLLIYLVKEVYQLILLKKYKKIIYWLFIILISLGFSFAVLPNTNFYKNIVTHTTFLNINNLSDIFTKDNFNRLVLSDRLTYLEETKKIYDEAPIEQKIIGIGYLFKTENKTIEMDYFDIYFRYGIIGSILILAPLVFALIYIIKNKVKSDKYLPYSISITLSLILALISGHVITAPSVSIYVAIIIGYLFCKKERFEYERAKDSHYSS